RLHLTGDDLNGAFAHTTGNRIEITEGNREVLIGGANRFIINSGGLGVHDAEPVYFLNFRELPREAGRRRWRKTEQQRVTSDSYSFGDSESFFFGFNFGLSTGLSVGVDVGGSLSVSGSLASLSASASLINASYSMGLVNYNWSLGGYAASSKAHAITAEEGVTLKVKSKTPQQIRNKKLALGVGLATGGLLGLTAGVGAGVAAATLEYDEDGSDETTGGSIAGGAGIAAGTTVAGVLTANAIVNTVLDNIPDPTTDAEIKMRPGGVSLKVGPPIGGSRVDITPTGISAKSGGEVFLEGTTLHLDFDDVVIRGDLSVVGDAYADSLNTLLSRSGPKVVQALMNIFTQFTMAKVVAVASRATLDSAP
ncbi:MAG: hypothetical protein AAGA56_27705, partial [Myxococcota bacterium]